jgi:hypothetical protein
MATDVVPVALIAAVEGNWNLDPHYRLTLSRSGSGLLAHQEAELRGRGRVVRDSQVEHDESTGTLRFDGLGSIHRTIITLRWSEGQLQYAFSSEISPGKWTQGTWEMAARSRRSE